MRGPRRPRRLAAAALNELSSEEDTGDSSSEHESDANTEEQVPNNVNYESANGTRDNRGPNISNIMQPDAFSTSSSNSSDVEEEIASAGTAESVGAHPGSTSHAENQDERDLSQEEVDKLVQLQDLTGIDDLQICRALLESKNWDLEATAREQFDPPDSGVVNQEQPLAPHDEAPEAANYQNNIRSSSIMQERNIDHGAFQENNLYSQGSHLSPPAGHVNASSSSINNRTNFQLRPGSHNGAFGLLRWGFYLFTLPITWPVRIAYSTVTNMFGFLSNLLGFGHLFGPVGHPRGRRFLPRPPATDPRGDVTRFREMLDQQYGPLHPPVYDGTYSQALERAKEDLRFLLVYLHCPSHQDTNEFCRKVICSPELTSFVSEQNVILWACSVDSGEGYRVSEALHESTYPFIAVIVLRQNRMMIVGRLEGTPPNPAMLVGRLNNVVRDNEAFIVAARADRAERHMNQTIRQEQDAALQDALRQDQEKERKKQEAEDEKRRAEEEEQTRVKEEQDRKERISRAKIDCATHIPLEPDKTDPDCIRIVIKLPEGQRLERRFLKTHSLKYLYYYVFCHPESPDDFDITTNFPKKVLNCKPKHLIEEVGLNDSASIDGAINDQSMDEPPTFAAAGIGQSTMLFVNDLDA